LVVKPLHGRGNRNNAGQGSLVYAYRKPSDPRTPWKRTLVSDFTHASHNFHPVRWKGAGEILTAAKEGVFWFRSKGDGWEHRQISEIWTGEIRDGRLPNGNRFLGAIEPMHGGIVSVYSGTASGEGQWDRRVLDETLKDGHAVVVADFLGVGSDQIVAGWRGMNPKGTPGARMFAPVDPDGNQWRSSPVSGEEVAVEDIKAGDLNGDGRPDLVLAGRQTRNLRILWNETPSVPVGNRVR
jgi:hypothetical protein